MDSYLLTQNRDQINQQNSIHFLEEGKVLFFPEYFFREVAPDLMTETILDGSRKNISYDPSYKRMSAYKKESGLGSKLTHMMQGYADFSYQLIQATLPSYAPYLRWGRTSFRPAQIDGRLSSKRKDDRRLHVDSFSASPVHGLRILRVFCNINPNEEPRTWNLGEPFPQVLERFASQISPYNMFKARVLKLLKITKTLRSAYDHYMLHLHDKMKLDDGYQAQVQKVQVNFPARSTWIVFTDQVSHAALSGQHLLEQTFYLPVEHMLNPNSSPLRQWQKIRPEV
jgi:hypothetical protein